MNCILSFLLFCQIARSVFVSDGYNDQIGDEQQNQKKQYCKGNADLCIAEKEESTNTHNPAECHCNCHGKKGVVILAQRTHFIIPYQLWLDGIYVDSHVTNEMD